MPDELEKITPELPPEKSEADLLKEQVDELKNKHLRALADLDNYKKRAAMEQDELSLFGNEALIKELLPALDNFGRALAAAKKSDDFVKGVALIRKQIEDALRKFGVEEVKALGLPYDPNVHEAIMKKGSDKPENTVIEEMQKGYTLKGRLVRPAMVIISEKKGE